MKITKRQLRQIIKENIFSRIKQTLGIGNIVENCFNIGETELKSKLSVYAQDKIRTVGVQNTVKSVDRRGDDGRALPYAIEAIAESVEMVLNSESVDAGEKYNIIYTGEGGEFYRIGGAFDKTLAHITLQIKEIDEKYSNVKVVFHESGKFNLVSTGAGVPRLKMDKILAAGIELLKQKFLTQDMGIHDASGTPVLRGDQVSRNDLFDIGGKLGFAGIVDNTMLDNFCTGVSRLANEFVKAKVEFTIDIGISASNNSYDQRASAIEISRIIDLKIYQAKENMRSFS